MAIHLSRWSQTLVGVRITRLLFCCSVIQSTFAKLTLCKPHEVQQASLPCPSLSPGVCSNSCPLNWWCHPNILSSVAPSPFAFNLSQHQGLFQWVESSHQVAKVLDRASVSASVLPMNIGLIYFRTDWFDLLAVQGTLRSSPILQFKSINSWALRLLNSPTLTSVHDYWKNHSFDYMDLCWQSDVSVF